LTNWSPGGWAHYLEGFTIYLSHANESAFSPVNGILLSDIAGGVPIVSMKEKRSVLRGGPYSTCYSPDNWEDRERWDLELFDSYSKNQCRQECMVKDGVTTIWDLPRYFFSYLGWFLHILFVTTKSSPAMAHGCIPRVVTIN